MNFKQPGDTEEVPRVIGVLRSVEPVACEANEGTELGLRKVECLPEDADLVSDLTTNRVGLAFVVLIRLPKFVLSQLLTGKEVSKLLCVRMVGVRCDEWVAFHLLRVTNYSGRSAASREMLEKMSLAGMRSPSKRWRWVQMFAMRPATMCRPAFW